MGVIVVGRCMRTARRCGRPRGYRRTVSLAVCAVLLVAAACGDTSEGSGETDPPAGGAERSPSDESGSSGGDGSQRLVYASAVPIRTLDFLGVFDVTVWSLLLGNVNEPLVRISYSDDGDLEWVPLLAESWEQIAPLQWRFTLRDDVLFENGQPLTAADAAFSINKEIRPEAEASVVVANLDRAEVVDDRTVDVFTTVPDNFVPRSLYRIGVQPDGWGVDNPDEAATTAMGTGPYRLTEFSPDRAVIHRRPGYWGENDDIIEEIEVRVIVEAGARLAAVQAGEVHVAMGLSPDLLAAAPATLSVPGVEVELLRIDTDAAPLDQLEVRQAMNMAIDRQALIDGLYAGFAEMPNGQGVPPQAFGYNPDLTDYPYDPDRARDIIAGAGAEGAELSLMCTIENDVIAGDVCSTVAQMLGDVGLDVQVDLVSFDEWIENGLNAPKNGLTPPSLFHIATSTDTLHAGAPTSQWFLCESARNTFCDPEVVAAIEAASAETELEPQEAAWQEALRLIRDKAPIVWLTVPSVGVATTEGVEGDLYPLSGDMYWSEWSLGDS